MIPFVKKKTSVLDEMQRQAKVRCNADVECLALNGQIYKGRVREITWYGLLLDRIHKDDFAEIKKGSLKLKFSLPREFGQLEVEAHEYSVIYYEDVIGGEHVSLDVQLPEGDPLNNIRAYLYHRNRSFIRNSVRRNRSGPARYFLFGLWGIVTIVGLMIVGHKILHQLKLWWIALT